MNEPQSFQDMFHDLPQELEAKPIIVNANVLGATILAMVVFAFIRAFLW